MYVLNVAFVFLCCGFSISEVWSQGIPYTSPGEINITALANQVVTLTQQVNTLKAKRAKSVMFTAHMKTDHFRIPANGFPFRFDQVITNIGGGYNPHSGVFHTPVAGNYLFILQIMGSPGTEMEAIIKYEGVTQTMLYVYGDKAHDMSTVTSVIHLNAGQEVTVERQYALGSADLRGGLWSQFSGTLLKAD